jgi:hypothetical protein
MVQNAGSIVPLEKIYGSVLSNTILTIAPFRKLAGKQFPVVLNGNTSCMCPVSAAG